MTKKIAIAAAAIIFAAALGTGIFFYVVLLADNINVADGRYHSIFLDGSEDWDEVIERLERDSLIDDAGSLRIALRLEGEEKTPSCGRYDLEPGVGNRAFINRLAYGLSNKTPLKLKMTRYTSWAARNLSRQILADSASVYEALTADSVLESYGLDIESSLAMFVRFEDAIDYCAPAEDVAALVRRNYDRFWTKERLDSAAAMGLTPAEVHVLASIVEEETNDVQDRRIVAGVYMNRLRRGMPLQACPTARYASGDFTLNRILKKHTQIDSPYNTYRNRGLPPGPIRIPSDASLSAVLGYVNHDYLYFCANPDFSGTHIYSKRYSEHSRVASRYRRELDRRGIR